MNADALFVIACPTCLGHLAAVHGDAGRVGCCPLCAATLLVPAADLPPAEPIRRERADPFAAVATTPPRGESTGSPTLVFHDPVKTVSGGETAVKLRRLTDEERRGRRARRNIVLLIVGSAILIMITVAFGHRPGR